jgi:hypothetical protein
MGYIGGRRGFGLRQSSHWERCKARAKATACDVSTGMVPTHVQPSIEEELGEDIESFKMYCSERSVDYWHDVDALNQDTLEIPGQDPERLRKLAESAGANVTVSSIEDTLLKHFTQISDSKSPDGIEPIHMQYLKEVAMQGSLPALSDLFVQRERIVMEIMQENESFKSQLEALMHQHGVQTSELLSLNRQSIAQRICSNAAFGDLAKMQKELQEQVTAHDALLQEHEKLKGENRSLREVSANDKLERNTAETLYDSLNRDYEALIEMNEVMHSELEELSYQKKLHNSAETEHKQTTIGVPYESTEEMTCYEQETCLLASQLY